MEIRQTIDRRNRWLTCPAWIASLFTMCLAAGVGCSEQTAPVTGQITMQGRPVGPGTIIFLPESNGNEDRRAATGEFGTDGRYSLTTWQSGDGALLGRHAVIIQGHNGQSYGEETATSAASPIPLRYADQQSSGLSAEVKPGANVLDFKLEPN